MSENQVKLNESVLEVEHGGNYSFTDEGTGEVRSGVVCMGWGGSFSIPLDTPGLSKVRKGQRFYLRVRLGLKKGGLKIVAAEVAGLVG